MEQLNSVNGVGVRQAKEWGEILSGFETKNRYEICDLEGHTLFLAAETGTSLLSLLFLQTLRPFEIRIVTPDDQLLLSVRRPFRFYFHEVTVHDNNGRLLGTVRRDFSLVRRLYTVSDTTGQPRLQLFGPILHPWTFEIRKGSVCCGRIAKKWSGIGKEMFTDADNFGIEFPADAPAEVKAVLLGAVFLIDFVHFEKKGNNR